jgi:hypothetical protein
MEISGLTPYQLQLIKKAVNIRANTVIEHNEQEEELRSFVNLQVDEQMEGGAWKRRIREKGFVI